MLDDCVNIAVLLRHFDQNFSIGATIIVCKCFEMIFDLKNMESVRIWCIFTAVIISHRCEIQ